MTTIATTPAPVAGRSTTGTATVHRTIPLGRIVTAGLLPASVRAAYGLPHHPRRFRAAIRLLRVIVRLTPRRLRSLPSRRLGPR